jgi:hypothetical protein
MLTDLVAVQPRPDFQLDLEFKNGEKRRFNMHPLLTMKPWNRGIVESFDSTCFIRMRANRARHSCLAR